MQNIQGTFSQVEVVSWKELSEQVSLINPTLAGVIDDIPQSSDLKLVKICYCYGDDIIKNGIASWLDDDRLPTRISQLFYRDTIPTGLILTKGAEVFVEINNRVSPLRVLNAGDSIGLWEACKLSSDPAIKHHLTVTAGARTVFSLAKIADRRCHARLENQLGIKTSVPASSFQQHSVFRDIANVSSTQVSWRCDVVFFTRQWMEPKTAFSKLHQYWLKQALECSLTDCSRIIKRELLWIMWTEKISKQSWLPKRTVASTLRHLITIGENRYPGFCVAQSDTLLPLSLLQHVYLNTYKLASPFVIMQPQMLSTSKVPIYYSLSLPTRLESPTILKNKTRVTVMNELIELKKLIDLFQEQQDQMDYQYHFFHKSAHLHHEISGADVLLAADPQFMGSHPEQLALLRDSFFFKGCIQIMQKKS